MKTDLVATGYIFANNKVLLVHHHELDKWIPVGGHIEENETPDETLIREVEEETGLDIKILNQSNQPAEGNVKENLATPFYVNTHSVGDHNHCSLFYICEALNPNELQLNHELKSHKWFTKEELIESNAPVDVKNQALEAFKFIK